jgi:putative NIF3 family GTP cyclohydrolase 1 type 2
MQVGIVAIAVAAAATMHHKLLHQCIINSIAVAVMHLGTDEVCIHVKSTFK